MTAVTGERPYEWNEWGRACKNTFNLYPHPKLHKGRHSTTVFSAEEPSVITQPFRYVSRFVLVRKHKNVLSVEKPLMHVLCLGNVRPFTLERSPRNAVHTRASSPRAYACADTGESTQRGRRHEHRNDVGRGFSHNASRYSHQRTHVVEKLCPSSVQKGLHWEVRNMSDLHCRAGPTLKSLWRAFQRTPALVCTRQLQTVVIAKLGKKARQSLPGGRRFLEDTR